MRLKPAKISQVRHAGRQARFTRDRRGPPAPFCAGSHGSATVAVSRLAQCEPDRNFAAGHLSCRRGAALTAWPIAARLEALG